MATNPLPQAPGGQERPLAFWKLLVIGLAGAGLGKMLADGILPFQALPFDEWGVARKWVPLLLGWALASLVSLACDFHGGCQQGVGKFATRLKSIGPGIAKWLAPHLAAAAADLAKEAAPENHEVAVSQPAQQTAPPLTAPPAPPLPEAIKHA